MEKCPTGCCPMRRDLENVADPFAFFADNYTLSGALDNLDNLSEQELKCAVCLFGTALLRMSRKRSFWEKLKRKITIIS